MIPESLQIGNAAHFPVVKPEWAHSNLVQNDFVEETDQNGRKLENDYQVYIG